MNGGGLSRWEGKSVVNLCERSFELTFTVIAFDVAFSVLGNCLKTWMVEKVTYSLFLEFARTFSLQFQFMIQLHSTETASYRT